MTVVIQIGNSDDKLTQKEWAAYVQDVKGAIAGWPKETHFAGASLPFEAWQNACFVLNVEEDRLVDLKENLRYITKKWRQDSIAFTTGTTEFI
jgi:hypothetical protein